MQFHEPLYQGTVPGTTLPYQVRLYLGMVARDSFMLPKRMLWSIIIGESIVLLILRPNIYSQLIHYQHETSRPEFATASSTAVSTCSNDNIVSTQRDLSTRQFTDHLCACFTDRTELRNAISQFLNDGCSDDNNCKNTVVQNYGWPIGSWCVSNVTDMSLMFSDLISFNEDLSSWDVSQVTDMSRMFLRASSFNQDLSSWDVSQVTDMSYIFARASSFNQDLSSWDVSQVTNMTSVFSGASSFNQDLSSWDVSQVTDMSRIFLRASSFNQDLSSWDVSQVTYMSSMFLRALSFNQDLSSWDVSQVTHMGWMFLRASSFNEDLSSWDVSQVTDMRKMFVGASSFNQDLSSWELRGICFFSNKVEFIHAVLLTTVVGVVRSHCVNNLFVCSSFSLYRFRFVANIYSCIIYNLVVCITPLICVKNAAQRSAVQRSASQCIAAQCSAVQRSAVQCSAVHFKCALFQSHEFYFTRLWVRINRIRDSEKAHLKSAVQRSAVQCSAVQRSAVHFTHIRGVILTTYIMRALNE
jgi:surface protein